MITDIEVKKIANLAKLNLKDDEISQLSRQLSNIMSMIDQLNEINCDGIEPLTSVLDATQRTRTDESVVENTVEDLFSNVPGSNKDFAKEIKCFIVPKVIE